MAAPYPARRAPPAAPRPSFDRACLPDPLTYYTAALDGLHGRGAWRNAVCPFHADTRPSLRVNVTTGAFRCMVCGAHGGDVLAFHQLRHQSDFKAAAKALGAWVDTPSRGHDGRRP